MIAVRQSAMLAVWSGPAGQLVPRGGLLGYCCYVKNLHEAVIDGDTASIIDQLQKAQLKDQKRIKRLGGVERYAYGLVGHCRDCRVAM